MSKNEMLDTDLYNFYLPTWEDDREKTINEFLLCETPQAWVDAALQNINLLLIDHANCEKKAASTALNLMYLLKVILVYSFKYLLVYKEVGFMRGRPIRIFCCIFTLLLRVKSF